MNRGIKIASAFSIVLALVIYGCSSKNDRLEIKWGLNTELTGDFAAVGASCKNAAYLFVEQVNARGGIEVNGKKIPLRLIVSDSGSRSDQAVSVAQRLMVQDGVLAMIGPNLSVCAIPASEVAESLQCPMISPWSTSPQTTKTASGEAKQYVFRTCFTDLFEINALAQFAINRLQAKRLAILYDITSEGCHSQATLLREAFEKRGGMITDFSTYTAGDRDFSAQLTKIKASEPDLIFLPAHCNDTALITQQARQLGLTQQFLGSDAWSTPDIITLAGKYIEGSYFFNHYSTEVLTPIAQTFKLQYLAKFGREPDDVAALTYDSCQLLARAIESAGKLDRTAIRDAFSQLEHYEGVTGPIQFKSGSGDPIKSGVVLKIQNGKFVWVCNEAG